MKKTKLKFQDVVPFIAFLVIFIFFTLMSYNPRNSTFRMLTLFNLYNVLGQVMQTIIIACGTLFVISQGHIDMSVGVNLALSGVIGTWVATATGIPFLLIPVALIVGFIVGAFNGVIVSIFKVPSFMVTLAMLIGVRGLVNFIQVRTQNQRLPEALAFLNIPVVKISLFIVIILIVAYVFEYTNMGRYSRAIGENETAAKFAGIPVKKLKLLAFALSGLMAGAGSVYSVVTIGATSNQMGVFFEMKVVMAIFLGGILVTGGSSAKFYKILLGSFSIEIIINGLAIMQRGDSATSQAVQGIMLLLMLLVSQLAFLRTRRIKNLADDVPDADIKGSSRKNSEAAE